ncbi:hypothetical protein LCGC14_2086910 [marine sediment metagenome]|uniref:Uncharacterized protein n=1 Tax=marine sediment metagenome TaxID=412755 RepID=A0A0F9EDS8_9ZZZZ
MNIYMQGTLLGIPMDGRISLRQPLALALGYSNGQVQVLLPFLMLYLGRHNGRRPLLPRWRRGVWGNRLGVRVYLPRRLVGVCLNVNGCWPRCLVGVCLDVNGGCPQCRPYLQATLCLGLGACSVGLDVGNNSELVPHWAPDLEAT